MKVIKLTRKQREELEVLKKASDTAEILVFLAGERLAEANQALWQRLREMYPEIKGEMREQWRYNWDTGEIMNRSIVSEGDK